jgi:DtxR family transcriptional regulator, Mn-dependent transcriptional regulator
MANRKMKTMNGAVLRANGLFLRACDWISPGRILYFVSPKIRSTSEATDDYLKAILELSGASETRVSSNDLAARLDVRPASVTGMLQKLARQRPPLVLYEKHHGVRLSAAGKRRAREIVRHHRLLELFLHDILKYSWDEVHEEAERLEHFISERFEDRVAAILGDPEIDPHGHVIPHRNGTVPIRMESPLLQLPLDVSATISSVSDQQPAVLRELRALGVVPGAKLIVERKNPNASLVIRIHGQKQPIRLSDELASHVAIQEEGIRPSG